MTWKRRTTAGSHRKTNVLHVHVILCHLAENSSSTFSCDGVSSRMPVLMLPAERKILCSQWIKNLVGVDHQSCGLSTEVLTSSYESNHEEVPCYSTFSITVLMATTLINNPYSLIIDLSGTRITQ